MKDTSIQAYKEAFRTGRLDTLRFAVLYTIEQNPNITRYEIAKVLNKPINCITGRVLELEKQNLIQENGKKKINNTLHYQLLAV